MDYPNPNSLYKGEYMKRIIVSLLLSSIVVPCYGFNLLTDIQQNTQWTLGSAVETGTAVALRSDSSTNIKGGEFVGSALASLANYRFLNLSAGGTFIPQQDGSLKAFDTGKIGINLGYFLKGFTNQAPAIIQNMVFGPSLATTLVTTPHIFIRMFDINYTFGK